MSDEFLELPERAQAKNSRPGSPLAQWVELYWQARSRGWSFRQMVGLYYKRHKCWPRQAAKAERDAAEQAGKRAKANGDTEALEAERKRWRMNVWPWPLLPLYEIDEYRRVADVPIDRLTK